MARGLYAALIALSVGCVPDTSDLESTIYEVCVYQIETSMESAGSVARGIIPFPDLDVEDAETDNPRVALRSIHLEASAGVPDLEFVDQVIVDVDNERLIELDPNKSDTIDGTTDESPNLIDFMSGEILRFTVELEGDIPRDDFRVRSDVCFDVDGVYVVI